MVSRNLLIFVVLLLSLFMVNCHQRPEEVIEEEPLIDHDSVNSQIPDYSEPHLANLQKVLKNNEKWVQSKLAKNPNFFKRHQTEQKPNYLWIGCSDSRVLANEILGLDVGEVFVMRNVANIVSPSDISVVAVIQFAVEVLKVSDIIVAGHYGCGGIKASLTKNNHGSLETWLSKLRRLRHKYASQFDSSDSEKEQARKMVEINVKEQVLNVATLPHVQQAWKNRQDLRIHGLVYSLENGRLIDLGVTMHNLEQLPEQLAVVEL